MSTEKACETVKPLEVSPPPESTSPRDSVRECVCDKETLETGINCAIKEYVKSLQKIREFSRRSASRTCKMLERCREKNVNHLLNGNCDTDSEMEQNYSTNAQLFENCGTNCDKDLQQAQKCETNLEQQTQNGGIDFQAVQSGDIHSQLDQDCGTDLEQTIDYQTHIQAAINYQTNAQTFTDLQNSPKVVQLPSDCHKGFHQSQDCLTDLQTIQDCPTDFQYMEDCLADLRKVHSRLKNLHQMQSYLIDLQKEQNFDIKSDASDTESNSNLSECTKDSDTSLEHSCDESNDKANYSNDLVVKRVKRRKSGPDLYKDLCALYSSGVNFKRSQRICKRKRDPKDYCPICGLTVRYSELENHFSKEVESLANIGKFARKPRSSYKDKENHITFEKIKSNRENRLTAKVARYEKNEIHCPVCKLKLTGSEVEINEHVLNCMGEDDYESDVNVLDRGETFDEYDFGEETRVRAISLVPGGYRSLHGYSSRSKSTNNDVDTELNVDIDDTLTYGKPQYTELDVIHRKSSASEEKEIDELRRAVVSETAEPHVIECKKWLQNCEIRDEIAKITGKAEPDIISILKEKIKDLEEQKTVKCLICLEPFTKPVVSTTCWHVHCEECWLVSMGVKKLCPQCNMIVFPTDLRRIYL